jgi:hypothetical protein
MPSLSPTQVSNLTSHSANLPPSNLSPIQFQSFSIPPMIKEVSLNLISDEAEQDQVALEFTYSSFTMSPSRLLPPQSTPSLSLPHQQHQTKSHQQASINNLSHYFFSQNSTPRSSVLTLTIFRTLNPCT